MRFLVVKIYGCIFGFHRLDKCPKCTPALRSSSNVGYCMVIPCSSSSVHLLRELDAPSRASNQGRNNQEECELILSNSDYIINNYPKQTLALAKYILDTRSCQNVL